MSANDGCNGGHHPMMLSKQREMLARLDAFGWSARQRVSFWIRPFRCRFCGAHEVDRLTTALRDRARFACGTVAEETRVEDGGQNTREAWTAGGCCVEAVK